MTPRRRVNTAPGVHQHTLFERLDALARRAGAIDPERPALAVFWIVLMLMGLGLLIQTSHAAAVCEPAEFRREMTGQLVFRAAGLALMLACARLGPAGLRRFVPLLTILCLGLLVLVFVPPFGAAINGSHRWLRYGSLSFQPSELARVVLILWIADRCVRLGPLVGQMRRGVLPMLCLALAFFGLILLETDLGAALLLMICVLSTMWVGGARPMHVGGSLLGIGGGAMLLTYTLVPYIRGRLENWLGYAHNEQVSSATEALASGGLFGVGLGQGVYRRLGVPYLESDFVLAQVGEELGLFGVLVVVGLLMAFTWFALRLVLSIRDRYGALCAFGLSLSTVLGAMLHVQVVAGLAPPKGMTLPFVSDGGTSLLVSSIAVGLAIGAARRESRTAATASTPAILTPLARTAPGP